MNNNLPLYKDKKFKSEKAFKEWLKKLTKFYIKLEDAGQDLLEMWIDERGEVLNCNLQSVIWNGSMVVLDSLKVDRHPIFDGGRMLKYKIIKCIERK